MISAKACRVCQVGIEIGVLAHLRLLAPNGFSPDNC
jgi:hypothetical protein